MHDTEIYEPRYCEGISQQKKRKPNSVDGTEYASVTVFRVRTRSFTFQFLLLLCAQTRCEQSTKTCAVCCLMYEKIITTAAFLCSVTL